MNKLKVGYPLNTYPYKRNIVGIVDNTDYVQVFNANKYYSLIYKVLNKLNIIDDRNKYFYEFSFQDYNFNKVDILHFFNNVSFSNTPWISTFETFIPRYSSMPKAKDPKVLKALVAISSDACKKLIAISMCTRNFQYELLKEYPEYESVVKQKMVVIHPPQQLFVNNYDEKVLKEKEISFFFIGREFFRKGGMEILSVLSELRKRYNIKLTIVSSFVHNDYATRSSISDVNHAKSIIESNANWINYYHDLPNHRVIEMMKNHHIGLLPTWADTYGYSVLEMQASGCPVITTDIRALPEINNDKVGWIIQVPKNKLGEAYYSSKEERLNLSNTIAAGLKKIVQDILDDPGQIKIKSELSIKQIKSNHSPEKYAKQIDEVYSDAIS